MCIFSLKISELKGTDVKRSDIHADVHKYFSCIILKAQRRKLNHRSKILPDSSEGWKKNT
jgi:hypothetical protein